MHGESIAKCKTAEELVNLQSEFAQSTVESYIQETQKLASLYSNLVQQSAPDASG